MGDEVRNQKTRSAGWVEHAEPRIPQVWQSHGVFVIKPKKHACVDRDCVLAGAFSRDGFLFL